MQCHHCHESSGHTCLNLWDIYLGVTLMGQTVIPCHIFEEFATLVSTVTAPLDTPINSVGRFPFLHNFLDSFMLIQNGVSFLQRNCLTLLWYILVERWRTVLSDWTINSTRWELSLILFTKLFLAPDIAHLIPILTKYSLNKQMTSDQLRNGLHRTLYKRRCPIW